MILHLFETDRFADLAIDKFEAAAPGNNLYLIDLNKPTEELTLLKRKDLGQACDLTRLFKDIESLRRFEFVILHGLSANMVRLVCLAPPEIKFIWKVWAGEVYCRMPEFVDHCVLAEDEKSLLRRDFDWLLRKEYGPFTRSNYPAMRLAFSRMRLCLSSFETDFLYYQSRMPYLKGGWARWAYNTLPEHYETPYARNIILGNSASPTNNHIAMLEQLSRHHLGNRKVIVPLSYGDLDYAQEVIAAGRRLLGDRFQPLTEFMEIDDYRHLLRSCDTMIMNQIQERGFGTIMIALNNGISVVLRPDSVIYRLLKPIGIKFFTTDELTGGDSLDRLVMTPDDLTHNRAILKSFLSFETIVEQTGKIIAQVNAMPA